MEHKKIKIYKLKYIYLSNNYFDIKTSTYEVFKKENTYVDENDKLIVKQDAIGKLDISDNSIWLLENDVDYFLNALIKNKKEEMKKSEQFIDFCLKYKNSNSTKKRNKTKIYLLRYSPSLDFVSLEYSSTEYDDYYIFDSTTIIDKDEIDKIICFDNKNFYMYSLNNDKERFFKMAAEYIKDIN